MKTGEIDKMRFEKTVQIIDCDCTASWQYFLSDDMKSYYKEIFGKVNDIYTKGQAVF